MALTTRNSLLVAAAAVWLSSAPAGWASSDRIEETRRLAAEGGQIRIVDGSPVLIALRPWQVALVLPEEANDYRAQFCGGVLLAESWVVTAAHCVDAGTAATEVQVLYGTDRLDGSGDRIDVARIVVHPAWDPLSRDSDVALLELAGAVRSRPTADLATAEQMAAATTLEVSGWGKTAEFFGLRSEHLLIVSLPLVPAEQCNQPDSYAGKVTDTMVCAGRVEGGQDSCQGDSGGPATIDHGGVPLLAGLVSWGKGCGRAKKYGVYTRLPRFAEWLRDTVRCGPGTGDQVPGTGDFGIGGGPC